MTCDTDFAGLKEDISELKVSQARAEEKIEGLNTRFEDFTTKVDGMDKGIQQIRDKVVNSSIDAAWLKRIVNIILTCLISGGGVAGYFQFVDKDHSEPVEHTQPANNNNTP